MKESTAVGHDLKSSEPPCMYYEESMASSAERAKTRGAFPGREYNCLLCGGFYSIRDGERPAQCKRPKR